MKKLTQFLGVICLLAIFCTCKKDDKQSDLGSILVEKCNDNDTIHMGSEYIVKNDDFGKGSITDYQQCVFKLKDNNNVISYGWQWQWPNPNGSNFIKGYPHILFGNNPWTNDSFSTTTKLPIKIKEISDITIQYTGIESYTGSSNNYNLAFDCWITNSQNPTKNNIVYEVMLWEDKALSMNIDGDLIRSNILNNYDLYSKSINDSKNGISWIIYYFIPNTSIQTYNRTIKLSDFINYLATNDLISNRYYLSNIAFGNEVAQGSGKTIINNYSINMTITNPDETYVKYNFENNSVTDLSTDGNRSGTIQGTASFVSSSTGRGMAAAFNGSWRILVNNSIPSGFSLSKNWTMALSINPKSNVDWGNGLVQRITDNGTCNRRGIILCAVNSGFYAMDSTYFNGNGKGTNIPFTLYSGQWNRVIIVHRADQTGDVYINGTKISSNISMGISDFSNITQMSIGGNYINTGCYGVGFANNVLIDDFVLFKGALASEQIASDNLANPIGF